MLDDPGGRLRWFSHGVFRFEATPVKNGIPREEWCKCTILRSFHGLVERLNMDLNMWINVSCGCIRLRPRVLLTNRGRKLQAVFGGLSHDLLLRVFASIGFANMSVELFSIVHGRGSSG